MMNVVDIEAMHKLVADKDILLLLIIPLLLIATTLGC